MKYCTVSLVDAASDRDGSRKQPYSARDPRISAPWRSPPALRSLRCPQVSPPARCDHPDSRGWRKAGDRLTASLTSQGWLTVCVAPPASFSILWYVRCATCSSRSPPRSPWCSPSWRTGARRLLILERLRLRGNGRLMLAPAARICQTNPPEEENKSRRKQISGVLLGTI